MTRALDQAVAAVDATRRPVLERPGAVVAAAVGLDAADEACATGDDDRAVGARRAVAGSLGEARRAVAEVPDLVAAYEGALGALREAAAPLDAGQERALLEVVAAGAAEAAAVTAFAGAAGEVLASYDALDRAQATWVDRATPGWYRDRAEAAGAYAVLAEPGRAALDAARASLRDADAARRTATDRQRTALAAADAALAPLRAGG